MHIPEVGPHHCEMLEENEAIQWSKRQLASCRVCCELLTVSEMRKTATSLERKSPAKDIHRFKNMKRNVRFNRNWTKLKKNNKTSGKIKYQLLDSVFHFFPQGFSKKFRHDGLHQVSTKVKSGQQPVLLEKQYENRTGKINGSCYLTYTYLGEKKLQSSENTLALQRNLIYSGKQGISKTSQTKSW